MSLKGVLPAAGGAGVGRPGRRSASGEGDVGNGAATQKPCLRTGPSMTRPIAVPPTITDCPLKPQ